MPVIIQHIQRSDSHVRGSYLWQLVVVVTEVSLKRNSAGCRQSVSVVCLCCHGHPGAIMDVITRSLQMCNTLFNNIFSGVVMLPDRYEIEKVSRLSAAALLGNTPLIICQQQLTVWSGSSHMRIFHTWFSGITYKFMTGEPASRRKRFLI